MIAVENLAVSLHGKPVIQGLSFSLDSEVLALMGPNGCGKTTLLRAIAGLVDAASGHLRVNALAVGTASRKHLARNLAFVPQEYAPFFSFSVEEMVVMGRTPHIPTFGRPNRADHMISDRAMSEVRVLHLRDRPFTELSGGERKLVLIAMALAQETQVVLLDEPTSFLDLRNSLLVTRQVTALTRERRRTVVFSTHDVNLALRCADKALMLFRPGEYIFGAATDVLTTANLTRLFGIGFEHATTESGARCLVPDWT